MDTNEIVDSEGNERIPVILCRDAANPAYVYYQVPGVGPQESSPPLAVGRIAAWFQQRFANARGIEGPACGLCQGSGWRAYGSTATWHGGIGGQAITSDICDRCWGSGEEGRPWTNLRTTSRVIQELTADNANLRAELDSRAPAPETSAGTEDLSG